MKKYKSIYELAEQVNMVIKKSDSYPNTYDLKNSEGNIILKMVNRKYLRYYLDDIIMSKVREAEDIEWDKRFDNYQKSHMAKVKRINARADEEYRAL